MREKITAFVGTEQWEDEFERRGILWTHSGDIYTEPFIRTSSGFISSGCFKGRRVQKDPILLGRVSCALANHPEFVRYLDSRKPSRVLKPQIQHVVGGATSGIALASYVAREFGVAAAFADKETGGNEKRFVFNGFTLEPRDRVVIVDDTVTTGATVLAVADALRHAQPDIEISPIVLVMCNRSGLDTMGPYKIASLVKRTIPRWKEGENPHTPDGKEILRPIEVKRFS